MASYTGLYQSPVSPSSYETAKFSPEPQISTFPVAAGKPSAKALISWKESALLVAVFACFGGSVAAVFSQPTAVYLGQTNQLIVIGFCLAIMTLACQRQVTIAFLLYSVRSGSTTLQDLEAVLRHDMLIARSSIMCRWVLFLVTAVPLGLSVAYKRFVGGTSVVQVDGWAGDFGLGSPPGYQNSGLGVSLIPTVYLPFWLNPKTQGAYSYNLLVESNDTGAALDMPLPEYVSALQRSLPDDEAVLITAVVNATVGEYAPIPSTLRSDKKYWERVWSRYEGHGPEQNMKNMDLCCGGWAFFASGAYRNVPVEQDDGTFNYSTHYLSYHDTNNGQTREGNLQQVEISRRAARGTWRVTPSNITLVHGNVLESMSEARSKHNQSLVDQNRIGLVGLYSPFITDYDHTRYYRKQRVNPYPSLIATMVWARLATQCGTDSDASWYWWREVNRYSKTGAEVETYRERTTLKREGALLLVLAILPLLSICATITKLWLYRCPINDGFGLISVLAATDSGSRDILRGAGLSGKLSRRVNAHFGVVASDVGERIEVRFDEATDTASSIRKNIIYG